MLWEVGGWEDSSPLFVALFGGGSGFLREYRDDVTFWSPLYTFLSVVTVVLVVSDFHDTRNLSTKSVLCIDYWVFIYIMLSHYIQSINQL